MIKFIKSCKTKDYPESAGEIVFAGRSNVSKSSLINALYGKIAYVGKTPGKTRLLNFFNVDDSYTVCDVPGYGFANRSEKELIEFARYHHADLLEELKNTNNFGKELQARAADVVKEFKAGFVPGKNE